MYLKINNPQQNQIKNKYFIKIIISNRLQMIYNNHKELMTNKDYSNVNKLIKHKVKISFINRLQILYKLEKINKKTFLKKNNLINQKTNNKNYINLLNTNKILMKVLQNFRN